jgi:PPOX class probable F420-dependent enzyme
VGNISAADAVGHAMQINDALEFIRDKRQGILITQKSDVRPQSSNIVFVLGDDGVIRISVTDGRAKTTNVRRTPKATLHVNRDDFWAYVAIEADVTTTPVAADPDDDTVDQLVAYYRALSGEHDDWAAYRQAMVDDRRLLLELRPTHAYGMLGG